MELVSLIFSGYLQLEPFFFLVFFGHFSYWHHKKNAKSDILGLCWFSTIRHTHNYYSVTLYWRNSRAVVLIWRAGPYSCSQAIFHGA